MEEEDVAGAGLSFGGSVAAKPSVNDYHSHSHPHPFSNDFWRRTYWIGRFFTWPTTHALGIVLLLCSVFYSLTKVIENN